ncbi:helix-turn-helix domain-containing protein [Kocuria rhizophila]|uniref:helix-turn-helix domain-containing protein n=1 Tax=Kocuria rhizophila TaxID=72000 RepID=UPI000A478EC8|nr:helix-turn-helix domain-containing protein [Kocuria rhizophila]
MSIEALRWAWEQGAKASHKFVLVTIANSADAFGEAKLSQDFLAYRTELSLRSVRDALKALEEAGLMTRVRSVRRDGTRGVDGVILHLERESAKEPWKGLSEVRRELNRKQKRDGLPAGKDHGPDLVLTSSEDIPPSQDHRQILPVAHDTTVDNSISPSESHRQDLPVGGDYRQISPGLPADSAGRSPRGHLPTAHARLYPSSSSVGTGASVADDDQLTIDDPDSSTVIATGPRMHRGVNVRRLAMEAGVTAGEWPEEAWVAAVDLILGRASGKVSSPQRFVTTGVLRDPTVMLDVSGFGSVDPFGVPVERQARRPQPRRRVTCPVHHTEHIEGQPCPGCRADAITRAVGED